MKHNNLSFEIVNGILVPTNLENNVKVNSGKKPTVTTANVCEDALNVDKGLGL